MRSEKERMLAGEWFNPADPALEKERERARELTNRFNGLKENEYEEKVSVLRELFGTAAGDVYLEQTFRCDYGSNIHVGNNFFANFDCVFLDVGPITFGDHCMLGPGVHIYTASHPMEAAGRKAERFEIGKPVTVGSDVWIGGGAIINPGVTIGNGAVLGSGAVVTKDVPPHTFCAGNPARVIRTIDNEDRQSGW
ncbi:acetyltransferase [Alteribacter lacisalsi]|uniref:Acetyltransferase n=1 Tax=Alteribacter lacisalsi TaxID=2045244 RepID=A0A2W0H2S1_9BACI|nr:sugar O-acetyltransferase [Alteribacter lacisalsi]PYZ96103.1 acetyltransferase [Alteribacter lacisalsi]